MPPIIAGILQRDAQNVAFSLAVVLMSTLPSLAFAQSLRQTADTTIPPGRITLRGVVRDEAGRGISGVEIQLGTVAVLTSDDSGVFSIRELRADTIRLVVRRLGYDFLSMTVPLVEPRVRTEMFLTLRRTHRLSVIEVDGKAYDRYLWDKGFYRRQRMASGSFFDTDFLEHFGGSGLGSVVREAQRVDVRRINNQEYAFSTVAGAPCRMNVFVDGVFQRLAMPAPGGKEEGLGLGELIGFRDVYAVEVYPRVNFVPTQFVRMGPSVGPAGRSTPRLPSPNGMKSPGGIQGENQDAACGAIVIWTRPISADTSGPSGDSAGPSPLQRA